MQWFQDNLQRELFRLGQTAVTPLSVLVFLATVTIAGVVGVIARRTIDRLVIQRGTTRIGLAYALGRITQYLIFLLGVVIGLQNVGINLTALAAAGAILTVGIGFGLQNIVQNFISGLILLIERPVQKGDFVIVGDTVGTVQEIAMRATRVVSRDGVSIVVPNSELVSNRVTNQSQPTSTYRVRITVGVAYGSDTELVRDTLLEVAQRHPAVLEQPRPIVFFRDFGSSSLDFELAVWLDDPRPEPAVTSDLRFAIDQAFRDRGVTIPFPQRDLHLRTGFEQVARTNGPRGDEQARASARVPPKVRDTSRQERETAEQVVREKDLAAEHDMDDDGGKKER